VSFEDSMHNLALQLSEVAQKYEQYWQLVEDISHKYEQLPTWVSSILGEMRPSTAEVLNAVQVSKEQHVASIARARNLCLDIAQAIIKAGGSGGSN
jgi:hypothetical protein